MNSRGREEEVIEMIKEIESARWKESKERNRVAGTRMEAPNLCTDPDQASTDTVSGCLVPITDTG